MMRKVKIIDQIIVATTTNNEDNKIVKFCKENKIPFISGTTGLSDKNLKGLSAAKKLSRY